MLAGLPHACTLAAPALRAYTLPPPQEHKYFDSADWALAKEGKGEQPSVSAEESLPPRTSPATITAHRASKLEGAAMAVDPPAPKQ